MPTPAAALSGGDTSRYCPPVITYLSIEDLARLAGISTATVRKYRSMDDDPDRAHLPKLLPPPDAMVAQSPGWLPETAKAWLKARAASPAVTRAKVAPADATKPRKRTKSPTAS